MFEDIQQSVPTAARRRLYGRIIDSADSTSGKNITTTGVKAMLSKNGTPFTSTQDIVQWDTTNAVGEFYVELTQAEADTIGTIRGAVPKAAGYLAAPLQARVVAYDPYADGASTSSIATASAAAILVTPANKLATDGSGNVAVSTAGIAAILATVIETNGGVTMTVRQALQAGASLTLGALSGIVEGTGTEIVTLRSATGQVLAAFSTDGVGNRAAPTITWPS